MRQHCKMPLLASIRNGLLSLTLIALACLVLTGCSNSSAAAAHTARLAVANELKQVRSGASYIAAHSTTGTDAETRYNDGQLSIGFLLPDTDVDSKVVPPASSFVGLWDFKTTELKISFDAIVIGAGIGGSGDTYKTAAAYVCISVDAELMDSATTVREVDCRPDLQRLMERGTDYVHIPLAQIPS